MRRAIEARRRRPARTATCSRCTRATSNYRCRKAPTRKTSWRRWAATSSHGGKWSARTRAPQAPRGNGRRGRQQMASLVAHGITGYAAGRALGLSGWPLAGCALLAWAPDLDLLVGLALEGDADAYHRAWWSHTPAVGAFGAAIAFG